MSYQESNPEEYAQIAEKVQSGEYFREARSVTDNLLHDIMAERYLYLLITIISLITFFCSLYAMQALLPFSRTVPFIYMLNDATDDLPRITPLRENPEQSVDDAVLFFLAKNYVMHYESYDIASLERNFSSIQHSSTPEVFAAYQLLLQSNNPDSPVARYQRHSTRKIDIISVNHSRSEKTLEIIFNASVISSDNLVKTKHKAIIDYEYSGVEFDKEADKVKPLNFLVTSYKSISID